VFKPRLQAEVSSSNFTGLDFVYITPDPGLPRLIGTDQRVLRFVEMFGGVLVLGRVAAPHMSADETQTQVNPGITRLYAVFAYMLVRLFDFDLVQVRAFFRHRFLFSSLLQESSF
jgi:hypothetical protein